MTFVGLLAFILPGLFLSACATEPNITDIRKQMDTVVEQQAVLTKENQDYVTRIERLESQVDEHDFLVGELIKTEEEASIDTRNLLGKLERASALLREQIEQTRASTQRRDRDLSIRTKALEARIDNLLQQRAPVPTKPATSKPSPPTERPSVNGREPQATQAHSGKGPNSQATVFRAAYKVYLNGQYDRAALAFQRFLKEYPSAALTPQAYYYLGDSLYVQKNYDAATKALTHVLSEYPHSKYVPTSLLKLGLLMRERDQISKARHYWDRVIADFPESSEALQAKEHIAKVQ